LLARANILLVDDDPAVIATLGRILSNLGNVRFATDGIEALRLAREHPPDLVLLDIEMPTMDGFELCAAMKGDAILQEIPVLFLTGHDSIEQEVTGLALGAVDFLAKPPHAPLVVARVGTHLRLKRMTDALRREATTDSLTGIANRRQFDDRLEREWQRSLRACTPLSLVMVDIDHFKEFNDCYGHPAGDHCLKVVAERLGSVTHRATDLIARFGGEEFVVLLPGTGSTGAAGLAERLVAEIDALKLPHFGSPISEYLTISAGASSFDETCASWTGPGPEERKDQALHGAKDLVAAADRALYAAKSGGRHRHRFQALDARSESSLPSPPSGPGSLDEPD